jgi:hypothetical protein
MKRRLKSIHFFLVIVTSFFVLGFPPYFRYCNLVGADFCSTDLSVEKPNQDNSPIDHPNELKISGTSGWTDVFLLKGSVFEQLPLIAFERSSLDQKTLTLRC